MRAEPNALVFVIVVRVSASRALRSIERRRQCWPTDRPAGRPLNYVHALMGLRSFASAATLMAARARLFAGAIHQPAD